MHANTILASTILALAAFGHAEPVPVGRRGASWYSDGLSAASAGIQEGASDASTWLASHTAGAADVTAVFATVTSVGGVAESIVTSVGGPAITLAASGTGVVTSFAGSNYTVVASPTSTTNAGVNVHPMALKASPVSTALVAIIGGTLLGAWLTC